MGDKGAKASSAQPPSVSPATESPAVDAAPEPEDKAAHCEACNTRFVPVADEVVCPGCLSKASQRRARAGYVLCEVVGPGLVSVNGFVDDVMKTTFQEGDVAEFAKADAESLPDRFKPAE